MTTSEAHVRVLAVFAHPDDETIGAGTLLAALVRGGAEVSVLTATRGERGEVIPAGLAHAEGDDGAMARLREEELGEALRALGVRRHLFLDQVPSAGRRFLDSGMRWVSPGLAGPDPAAGPGALCRCEPELLVALVAATIRHVRPTVVLTEDPGGTYGHPDHVRVHEVVTAAVALAARGDVVAGTGPGEIVPDLAVLEPWRVPTVLWSAHSAADRRTAEQELADHVAAHGLPEGADGRRISLPPDGTAAPSSAVEDEALAAVVDAGDDVIDAALEALRAHRSQIQAVTRVRGRRLAGYFALSNDVLLPVLDRLHLRPAPDSSLDGELVELLSGRRRSEPGGPGYGISPSGDAESDAGRPAGYVEDDLGPVTGGITVALALAMGVLVSALGTVVHRAEPAGIVLALAAVVAVVTFARALGAASGAITCGLSVVVVTQVLAFVRPGDSVLVAGDTVSYVWLLGAPLAALSVIALPRRWFRATPRVRSSGSPEEPLTDD